MFNIKWNLSIIVILIAIFFNSCGGSGGSGSTETQTDNTQQNDISNELTEPTFQTVNSKATKGIIELGLAKEASVSIQSLDGHTLLTLDKTDENGEFYININSEIKSIVPLNTLYKTNGYRVNFK
jgi:hypothetical protein